jgi:hypothetical protein
MPAIFTDISEKQIQYMWRLGLILKPRRQFQNQAVASIDAMLGDMDIAYALFNVDDDRIDYWTGLIIEVQNLVREWRKSDQERYKNLK